MATIKEGSIIILIKEGSKCHTNRRTTTKTKPQFIRLFTIGKVIATRLHANGKQESLVKFKGHGGYRHCNANEIRLA